MRGPAAGVPCCCEASAAGSYERTSLLVGPGFPQQQSYGKKVKKPGPESYRTNRTGRIPTKMVDVLLNCRKTTPKMMLHCRLGMPTLVHDDEDGDEKHVAGIPLDEGVTTADVAGD